MIDNQVLTIMIKADIDEDSFRAAREALDKFEQETRETQPTTTAALVAGAAVVAGSEKRVSRRSLLGLFWKRQ